VSHHLIHCLLYDIWVAYHSQQRLLTLSQCTRQEKTRQQEKARQVTSFETKKRCHFFLLYATRQRGILFSTVNKLHGYSECMHVCVWDPMHVRWWLERIRCSIMTLSHEHLQRVIWLLVSNNRKEWNRTSSMQQWCASKLFIRHALIESAIFICLISTIYLFSCCFRMMEFKAFLCCCFQYSCFGAPPACHLEPPWMSTTALHHSKHKIHSKWTLSTL
jgi:hypothetical protein